MATNKEVFQRYLPEYLKASKKEKQALLDTVCEVTSFHRKAAIRKFRNLQLRRSFEVESRGRPIIYGNDVIAALKFVWQTSSEICGELLHPVISEYVDVMRRDRQWIYSTEATDKLLQMSEGTVKSMVGRFMKVRNHRHGLCSTSPSILKNIIPIIVGEWNNKPPGYGQIDTVVHCGSSLLGDLVYTVNYTDIATLWHGLSAQWNKGQYATKESIKSIKGRLPFKLKGIHPDTGSEFINWHLKDWCEEKEIELTRSRPNHKNDNAYVEQKNGHVVRRFVGYIRLDNPNTVKILNNIYQKLELYLNHFVPSRKCIKKVRIGSKHQRKYDKAQTPYQRVLAHSKINQLIKNKLTKFHQTLNPLNLKGEIDKLLTKLIKIQQNYGNHNPTTKY